MSFSKKNSRGPAVLAVLGNIAGGALALAMLIPFVWVLGATRRDAPAGTNRRRPLLIAPSPFCSAHPGGSDTACRPCGTARVRQAAWLEAHRAEVSR